MSDVQLVPGLSIAFHDLGRADYQSAYDEQRRRQQLVIADRDAGGRMPMPILFVEHDPPVITVSRRRGARDHLLATDAQLAAAGVTVAETDRGGDITYHGPGQLVVYPILDLNRFGLRLHGYMRLLEEIVITALAAHGIAAARDPDATGVWIDPLEAGTNGGAKICAMGVRVSRWVSMHGFALNVNPNLAHFDLIVPCGLTGRRVTSVARERGIEAPDMAAVKECVRATCTMQLRERAEAMMTTDRGRDESID